MAIPSNPRVLVAGVSTRAIVDSAVRAGYAVSSIDAYADLDQPAAASAYSLPRDMGTSWSPRRAARYARDIDAGAVVYGSNWENHPRALATLARGRQLWGNDPACLRRVRDPRAVGAAFRADGVAAPDVRVGPEVPRGEATAWVVKPMRSGGGHGVRRWNGAPVPRTWYLQRHVDGQAGSVVFVAATGRAMVLGVTTQIVGDASFGATDFRYCGSVLWPQAMCGAGVLGQAATLAAVAAQSFRLVGVGSIDFVYRDGVMHPIEVNPRWTASLELVERACGLSIFATHVAASRDSALPARVVLPRAVCGKAVVFARDTVRAGATERWLDDVSVRDVPRPGTLLVRGAPVCTVFAEAPSDAECVEQLRRRAAVVYDELSRWRQEAA